MKIVFRFTKIILTIIIHIGNLLVQTPLATNIAFSTEVNPPITHQQTKAQVELFREALDKLGATSPEQVINIWASGESMRNAVYHYAVACNELKSKIIKELGEPKESYWIIGGSSPWVERYEIVYNKKLNDSESEARIRFFWVTSTGPFETTETTLNIVKNKDTWCVNEVK